MIVFSVLLMTFPDTISHHARERARQKKIAKKTKAENRAVRNKLAAAVDTSRGGDQAMSSQVELTYPKRVLHTIDELIEDDEQEQEKNSDLGTHTPPLPASHTPPMFANLDSISTISSTVSSFTSRSTASLLNTSNETVREIRETDSVMNEKGMGKDEQKHVDSSSAAKKVSLESEGRLKSFITHRWDGIKTKLGGFVKSLLKLFTNFRYVMLIVILSFECIIISIFTHYMILYSQHVYKISNSKSSIMIGGIIVPAAIIGA
jgi:hypothetical protein